MLKGIKLDGKKYMSLSDEVVDFCSPSKVYVPLINNNVFCECLTKKGKKVKKGTIIGIRNDLDFPILSPVSGTVVDIKTCLYLNGEEVNCVVIENDKKESILKKKLVKDITKYTKEEFISLLKNCQVTGMGGGDYPAYLKYEKSLHTLIVNAVECEPYISSDLMLVKLKAELILESIDAIMKINNIEKCYIAYKEKNSVIKDVFLEYIGNYKNIILFPLKDVYPMGWEKYIIKSILKEDYDKHPAEIGVVVNNISTIFAIYKALKFQRNITKRIITISGEGFSTPVNILVKVGTDLSTVIKKIGKYEDENLRFIAGGPMMGESLPTDNLIVTKNLCGVTILGDVNDEVNRCIGCGRCVNVCPAKLCPIFILKNINNKEKIKNLHPERCVECGLCSYVCPSKIGLRDAVKISKKKVNNK